MTRILSSHREAIDLPDDHSTPHPDEASTDVSSFRIGVRNALAITVGLVAFAIVLVKLWHFVRFA